MTTYNHNIKSDPDTYYTEALDASDREQENFPAFSGDGKGKVVHLAIKSKENLAWVVEICDLDDNVLESHAFTEEDARPLVITEGGEDVTYYFYDTSLWWGIPMLFGRAVPVNLRNNSETAKTAGSDGAVTIFFVLAK